MKRIFIIVLSVLALFFFSCKKHSNDGDNSNSNNNNSNNQNPTGDPVYLDKIYALDETTLDTVLTVVFNYDALKRLTSMTSPASSLYSINNTYYYNGSDTLPYKSARYYNVHNRHDTVIAYHTYDNNQRNLKDSVYEAYLNAVNVYIVDKRVIHYSYEPGKKYAFSTVQEIIPSNGIYSVSDTAILDTNNNIISGKYWWQGPGTPFVIHSYDITYDEHVSPFKRLSNFKAHSQFIKADVLLFDYLSSKDIHTVHVSSVHYTFTNRTYNNYGLPAYSWFLCTSGTESDNIIYTYKSL